MLRDALALCLMRQRSRISIGVGSVLLIPQTEIDPEIRNYIPRSIKSRIETDNIESEFGVQDMVMLLFSDSTILTTDNLKQIKAITWKPPNAVLTYLSMPLVQVGFPMKLC